MSLERLLKQLTIAAGITIGVLGLTRESYSKTIKVSQSDKNTYTSIQSAIDTASDGMNIFVEPGVYYENIDFKGKNITVKSSQGPQVTTIDGRREVNPVVRFYNNETNRATLEGFTITKGTTNSANQLGGGIYIGKAGPTICGNIIVDNGLDAEIPPRTTWGGGIMCYWVDLEPPRDQIFSPIITGNTITNNRAYGNGGGIGIYGDFIPTITGNTITNNNTKEGDGGGLWLYLHLRQLDGGRVERNKITGNVAGDHGGGIYLFDPFDNLTSTVVSDNVIANNTALARGNVVDSGGGIWVSGNAAWIHRNTIVGNIGPGPDSTWGGGIAISYPNYPTLAVIEYNIIAYSSGGGIHCVQGFNATIRNNLAWENRNGDGIGPCAGWENRDGNIMADPLFCNLASGDYSLAENSPALTYPAGVLGAISIPGCKSVPVIPLTWGRIKIMYRTNDK